ncbi:MAG: protease pro-enzyme activation domain-containing protein, partial [Candidatus Acidiferrales bacterium]
MQNRVQLLRTYLLAAAVLFLPFAAFAQTSNIQPRITAAVNESQLTTLRGNTHPYAQGRFDRGAAPDSLPMARMMLVLKRSAAQEAALDTLLDQQQDSSSPNYHAWLTPQQFGQEFGPADADIQTIVQWLASHGFQVNGVSNGRTVIEFSGTAGQVRDAFHTEIHRY